MSINWTVTPVVDDADLGYRCDLCGQPATDIYLLGYTPGLAPTEGEARATGGVAFGCARHAVADCYTGFPVANIDERHRFMNHWEQKYREHATRSPGVWALARLDERIKDARRSLAASEAQP